MFLETTYRTEMGQLIDLTTADEHTIDLNRFSLDKFVFFFEAIFLSTDLPAGIPKS